MATTEHTTYTHNCDLCGEERDKAGLIQLQQPATAPCYRPEPLTADVCESCLARPISVLKEFLDAEAGRRGFVRVKPAVLSGAG
jgi:hypothetical protein